MRSTLWVAGLFAGVVASVVLLWGTTWPLGIPGEWVWPRLPADEATGANLWLAGGLATGYLVVVLVAGVRLQSAKVSCLETAAWLAGLVMMAFAWLWCVQETAPPAGSLGKAPFVLFYPSSSGYFTLMRGIPPAQFPAFLAGYEALMRQGDVLHIGTHPPGLFCAFQALAALVDNLPQLHWLDALQPESVRESFAVLTENTAQSEAPLQPREVRILWLAMLTAQSLAAMSVIPLYAVLRWTQSRAEAFLGASLWPTVPAVAIFLPKSDAIYPVLSLTIVWLAVESWRRWQAGGTDGRSVVAAPGRLTCAVLFGIAAGVCAWLGLFLSLAFMPVLVFVALFGWLDGWRKQRCIQERVGWLIPMLVGFALPPVLLYVTTGLNLLTVWWLNYLNHAGFYAQYPRHYFGWLWRNPVELTLAVGWPVMATAWYTSGGWIASIQGRFSPQYWPTRVLAAVVGAGVWGLLWLSGKNSGEAARLWLLLMPGVVWLATHGGRKPETSPFPASSAWILNDALVLILSLATCIATVHRVGGFHF